MNIKNLSALNVLAVIALCALTAEAKAQAALPAPDHAMLDSVRAGWSTLIFVSTEMPRATLVDLAREAARAKARLVLRGLPKPPTNGAPLDFPRLGEFATSINVACCKDKGPAWIIDPRLFERYAVRGAPTFVLTWGESGAAKDFSRVEGDMALANALKFFAQQSALPAIRAQATTVYDRAFGGQP